MAAGVHGLKETEHVKSTTPTAGVAIGLAGLNQRKAPFAPGVSSTGMTPLQRAVAAAQQGLMIVPMHNEVDGACSCSRGSSCSRAGKHPRITKWQQNGAIDLDVIRKWWQQWPDAQFAVVTGQATGPDQGDIRSVVVLDFDKGVDGRKRGLQTLNRLRVIDDETVTAFRETFQVATPGSGWHVYFLAPAGVSIKTQSGLLPGLDIRGDGGCVVGPWCLRAGKEYHPFGTTIYPLPAALLQLLTAPANSLPEDIIQQPDRIRSGQQTGGSETQEGHKRDTKETQERLKRVGVVGGGDAKETPSVQINLAAMPEDIREAVKSIVARTLPTSAGTRHRRVFDLARQLRSLPGWWDIMPVQLLPIVRVWHDRAQHNASELGFRMNGCLAETFRDFRDGWQRVHTKAGRAMSDTEKQCRDAIQRYDTDGVDGLPEPVRDVVCLTGMADRRDVALVLLCWCLPQQWPNGVFPLDCRTGSKAVMAIVGERIDDRHFRTVSRRLKALVADGVLELVAAGKRGQAAEYRWCGAASAVAAGATAPPPTWL